MIKIENVHLEPARIRHHPSMTHPGSSHRPSRLVPAACLVLAASLGACEDADSATDGATGGGSGLAEGGASNLQGAGGAGDLPSTESTLLDDLDDCDGALDFAGTLGTWYAYNATCEGMVGEQLPPPECRGEPFTVEAVEGGCRARTVGSGFPFSEAEGWGYALIGIRFAGVLDLCQYSGLELVSGGTPLRVKVATLATDPDSDHFGISLSAGEQAFTWSELAQEGWGAAKTFDCSQVTGLLFQAADPTSFDFWIDDLAWTAGDGSASGTGGSNGAGGTSGTGGVPDYTPLSTEPCADPNLTWRTARKTTYTSYPDPNSEECVVYNGCTWAGQFAHCSGVRPESWVASRDIAAIFPDDGFEGHNLCLRSGDRVMVVTAIDTCADSDCDGCCTTNRGTADALIDLESYTNARWGLADGLLEWADLGPNDQACAQ